MAISVNNDFDLIVTLESSVPRDSDDLQRHMMQVLHAVEEHASDIALGPVVSCNLVDSTIELAFTVTADSLSKSQSLASEVMAIIEQHTDINFSSAAAAAREPDSEPAYALAC